MTKSVSARLRKAAKKVRTSTVKVTKKITNVFVKENKEPSVHELEIGSPVPNSFIPVTHLPARTAEVDVASVATGRNHDAPVLEVQLEVCRRQLAATSEALSAAQATAIDLEREVQLLHLQLDRAADNNRVLRDQKRRLWDNAVDQARTIRALRNVGSRSRQQLKGDVLRLTADAELAAREDMKSQEMLSRLREQNGALGTVVLFMLGFLVAVDRSRLSGNVAAADQDGNIGTA